MSERHWQNLQENSQHGATLLGAAFAVAISFVVTGVVTIITSYAASVDREVAVSPAKRAAAVEVVVSQRLKGDRLDRGYNFARHLIDDHNERNDISGSSIIPKSTPPLPLIPPGPHPDATLDDDCEIFTIAVSLEEGSGRSLQFRCTASVGGRATIVSRLPSDAPCEHS